MVTISRILCAVDFSTFSLAALDHGLVLANWYSAELTVAHIYVSMTADQDDIAEKVRRFCAPSLGAFDHNVKIVVRYGDAPTEISREAERLPADLLVLGTQGEGFKRVLLGSVTERVLRRTRVPVLTIPASVRHPGSPFYKTILCPVDFSDASVRAIEYALSLAKQADARLILLHVIETVLGDAGAETLGHLMPAEYHRHREQDAMTQLKAIIPEEARVWSTPIERVVLGRAHHEILKIVADEGVEVIVMGVRGKGALNRLVYGSTTHRVIREAGCPVLTLHSGA